MATPSSDKPKPRTNGSLSAAKPPANGLNGTNGHAASPQKPMPKKKRTGGFFSWSFNLIARLLTWYSICTILFRCPPTLEACTESSPRICKPYFHLKEAVSPHLAPYYDTYASPYVELAKPYYQVVDRSLITPGRTYAVKFGGPRVAQVQSFSQAQWEKNIQPQMVKYQALAKEQYDRTVAPYVRKASEAIAPYYTIARTNAMQTYHDFVLPSYLFVEPYAAQGYEVAYAFTTKTAIPTTIWAWKRTYSFLDSTVWPHLRDVYLLKVEPQLVRIGERLGRYKGKQSKSVTEEGDVPAPKSTFTRPSTVSSTVTSNTQATADSRSTSNADDDIVAENPPVAASQIKVEEKQGSSTPEEIRERAARIVAEDLELWEGKFTQAAEEGAVEIEERVDEIAARMIERNAMTMGKSLVSQLEDAAKAELESLKHTIVAILEKYPEDAQKRDEELVAAIRNAGLVIKSKAQNIRDWRQNYEQETEVAVTKAAQEHFAILEETRDLALQRIGMKWAWMDGVTYKDWKKYHELKARFDDWTEEFKNLITTHPGLLAAQAAGSDIEDEAMAVAKAAAEELGRLRQVATWKAIAGDFTDDFDSSRMESAAIAVAKKATEGAEAGEGAESVAPSSDGDAASETTQGDESTVTSPEEAETVTVSLSEAKESVEAEAVNAETSSIETNTPLPASEPVDGPEQVQETIIESPDEYVRSPEDASTATVKSALFGAAAQSVPSRQPILDEDVESSVSSVVSVVQSDIPASVTSAAQAAYSSAVAGAADHYSRAMAAVSAQVKGEPKPVHEEMFSSVTKAYLGAIASANSRLNAAVTAVSEGVYGTPTTKQMPVMPTVPSVDWEKAQSIAHQNLQDSIDWAVEQYESAKVAIGAAEPTPSTYLEGAEKRAEKLLDQAKHNYYAGIGLAHARYSEFLSAASTAVSSLTATPTPTNIQESASSVASVAGEPVSAAASAVGEKWDSLVSLASSQVYGAPTPTPWYENLYAAAGDYAASAADAGANQASSATSLAGDYAASATDAASSQYSALSSLVSELVVGKEPPFTESVYSRLAEAYATGSSSASSLASAASASVVSAADHATESAGSVVDAARSSASSVANKVKETVEQIKDEL
ncbi:hypothetical protein F4809DRAFT_645332 [Biscogniauxia mediterranea]|nr:hypothetical protein F4809DRAFT_645332 [Biscogniauxia mediterranea]